MTRSSGKAQDDLLDWANQMKGRIDFAQVQIEMYRESGGLTENEIEMLNTISAHLAPEPDR